jgi:hypothetical protein
MKADGKLALLFTCFHTGLMRGLLFDPEDGGYKYLPNVD